VSSKLPENLFDEAEQVVAENIREIADQTDDVTQRLLVQAALKSLSALQRAVLVLVYEHQMVLREVADVLQIPIGTAASHLARGKAAVAAYIEVLPELEKSAKKEISSQDNNVREIEIITAEVVNRHE
jgi:DNA-directed RNA polymerase specialized sigma24 family protein